MIPEFLKRQNKPREKDFMSELLEEYKKHFKKGINTEPFSWSEEEWIQILQECINSDTELDVLLGIEYDPDADY